MIDPKANAVPMTDEELSEIETSLTYALTASRHWSEVITRYAPRLLGEVHRLRMELAGFEQCGWRYHGEWVNRQSEEFSGMMDGEPPNPALNPEPIYRKRAGK